jgi:hypothetical protein
MSRAIVVLPLCVIVACPLIACVGDSQGSMFDTFAAGEHGSEGDGAAESGDGEPLKFEIQLSDESDGGSDDEGDPIKFDIIDPDATGEHALCGVDILFVVDNSGSMSKHKDDIIDAFDNFIAEMTAALEFGTPVHIAVTRATGFYNPGNGSGWMDPECSFGFIDGDWFPPTKGNNGINGQQGRLYEQWGKRYYEFVIGENTSLAEEWFEGALEGAIQLVDASNSESVVAGAAYPFHPINAQYNQGFSREQSVLVLFLISDAPDATPTDIPTSELITMVTDAKSECGETCVLPTGIVQSVCYGNPLNQNQRLFEFLNGFGGPPAAVDFFFANEAPESFTSVLGATLAETIAHTCDLIAE